MGQDSSRWRKRCRELNRIPQDWYLHPPEDLGERLCKLDELAAAGEKWAADEQHPWELFVK